MNDSPTHAPHLFVTGCSAGIGKALCTLAVRRGWRVSGCARSRDRLVRMEQELGARFLGFPGDVTRDGDCRAAVAAAVGRFGPLRALAANAGRGIDGEITECSVDDARAVFDLNLFGVHRAVAAALPHLVDGGSVVITSSVVSRISLPRMGFYCASKHALDAYAAALRMEQAPRISVCTVEPATVATGFFDRAAHVGRGWTMRPGRPLTSEDVARAILRAAINGRPRRRLMPFSARVNAWLYRALPGLVESVLRRALRRMRAAESQGDTSNAG